LVKWINHVVQHNVETLHLSVSTLAIIMV
jgi:hypothetical protein